MRKYLFLIAAILMITAQKAFCIADLVSPELGKSLKIHTDEPSILSILFALLIVICLIYITGLIYSRLNIAGARTVQKHLKHYDLSKVIVISTTPLGQNKNLHVIEINKKRYLIGATQTSINLIKELEEVKKDAKEEIKKGKSTSSAAATPAEPTFDDAIQTLYGKDDEVPQLELDSVKEFDVHKKYL